MNEQTNRRTQDFPQTQAAGMPLPQDVLEQIDLDIAQAGGEWEEPAEYQGAIGRTMRLLNRWYVFTAKMAAIPASTWA